MGYSRGFGVQSPSAYSFIRYVLNEHYPYYAYAPLCEKHKAESHATKKKGRLYFRLANFAQATCWYDYLPETKAYADYVCAGCQSTVFKSIDATAIPQHFRIARLSMKGDYKAVYEALSAVATADSILILEGIYDNRDTKAFWKQVVERVEAVTTYDLYSCGIVLFDTSKFKHHYIVNF
jgi:hypothetical protein